MVPQPQGLADLSPMQEIGLMHAGHGMHPVITPLSDAQDFQTHASEPGAALLNRKHTSQLHVDLIRGELRQSWRGRH